MRSRKLTDRLRTVYAETTIHAPVETVWQVLLDLEQYPRWNTFAYFVESSLGVGDLIRMKVKMHRLWHMNLTNQIRQIEPYRMLCWGTRYPRWLLYGDRYQTLKPLNKKATHYETWETYYGLLGLPTMTQAYFLKQGFEKVCAGLKTEAETRYAAQGQS